jgi:pimeloyl-[acyl-carrier protein] methyl ester esterase
MRHPASLRRAGPASAGPPQGANCAPLGASTAAQAASVGAVHRASLHIESTGHGPPLVLLHGWAMHSGLWGPLLPRLAKRYRVHAVDLPGHGHSAELASFTLDTVVDALDAAFRATEHPLTVLGWSLGGLVAMRWALADPARIGRIALVCTSPRFVEGDDWPHAMSRATLDRFGDELHVSWKLTVQRFLSLQIQGGEHARATLAELRSGIFARGKPAPRALLDALATIRSTDLRAEVHRIAQPALVVSGSRDTLTLPDAGRWLAEHLPAARFALIRGAAHAPFLSHPEAFAGALDGFLDGR